MQKRLGGYSYALCLLQIDGGDYKPDKGGGRGSGGSQMIVQILEKYYPIRYRDSLSQEEYKTLCDSLVEKWTFLKGKNTLDCVRIYLTCTRKWPFFGATLFNVTVRSKRRLFISLYHNFVGSVESGGAPKLKSILLYFL